MNDRSKWLGILLVLITGACWGFHGVVIKLAFQMGASFLQVFLLEVGLAMFVFALLWKRFFVGARPQNKMHWLQIMVAGIASIGVGNFLFLSFSLGPVAIGATLLFMYLPQVYVVSLLMKWQSFQWIKLFALGLLLLGAVFATNIIEVLATGAGLGAILAGLAGSTCYALIFILTPGMASFTTTEFRSFILAVIGTAGCLVILFFQPHLWGNLEGSTLRIVLIFGGLLCFGQTVPVYCLMKGLPLTGSSLGGVLASVELPIAVIAAALILGESLTWQKTLGVLFILFGIVVYNVAKKKSA